MKRKLRNRSKTITFLLFAFLFAASSGKNQSYPDCIPGKINTFVEYTYPTIYCWVDHLRIRDAASFNSNVIGKLMKGDSVVYLNEKNQNLFKTFQ